MADQAPASGGGDSLISGGFVIFVLIVLLVLWLRHGGWNDISHKPINFGWQGASTSTGAFPFTPNFTSLAPRVGTPAAPQGPARPQSPDPYNR